MICTMNHQSVSCELARQIRIGSLITIYHAGSGHPGGSLSAADLLAVLWGQELRGYGSGEVSPERDRFILSKGHACPALYAAAAEVGLLSKSQLLTLRKLGSALQGHPHVRDLPWVETSTGSLGQGFSAAIGMAMGLRYLGRSGRVYVLLGDGELQEGEVWEGAMCAAHHRIDNLCAMIDYNKMQSDDLNEHIMGLEPLRAKWEAFGWHVIEIDGHDHQDIVAACEEAKVVKEQPTVIVAHTIKGRGVSFMEGNPSWHGSVKLRKEELEAALEDLSVQHDDIRKAVDGTLWLD